MLLMTLHVFQVKPAQSAPLEGLSVLAMGELTITTLQVNCLIYQDKNLTITINSDLWARGTKPKLDIYFYSGESVPILLGQASVIISVIVYYRPDGGKNIEVGTFYRRLIVDPENFTDQTLYEIDFKESMNEVFDYFSTRIANLTRESVGFAGSLSVQTEFANATGIVSQNGYFRFTPSFDGNITSAILDITVPEDYDLTSYTIGEQDMAKVFPNRVQKSFSVTQGQGISTELYLQWKIPAPPPPPPFYDVPPWKWLVPGFVGVFLTITVRDVAPRLLKRARKKRRTYAINPTVPVEGKNDTNSNEAEDNEKHGRGRSATEGYTGLFLASVYGVIAAKLWDSLNLSAPNLASELLFILVLLSLIAFPFIGEGIGNYLGSKIKRKIKSEN